MKLMVIGLNHKTAPVVLRERLAFVADELTVALDGLKSVTESSVIVSTCNRTEIYALIQADDFGEGELQLKSWLAGFKNLSLSDIEPYLYSYHDARALTHWLRVASGLDSMILGEPQILGQIKQAVAFSQSQGAINNRFAWLIDQVFASAKQVRNETNVGKQAVSLGFAAAKLVTQIFDHLSKKTLLVVAAGEMNRLVATHIAGLGLGRIIICNRSPERAKILADELQQQAKNHPERQAQFIEARPLEQLAELLPLADVVSSCSGSMDCLISQKMVKAALKQRRHQPMLMVDLAVPRDIEPSVAQLDEIFLYSIDDLQHVIAGNLEQRRQAAVDAELLVSHLVLEIERRLQVRQVGKDIKQYRDTAHHHAEQILQDALIKLEQGQDSPESIMKELARMLTQNLTHAPSKLLRAVAKEGDADILNLVVNELNGAYRH